MTGSERERKRGRDGEGGGDREGGRQRGRETEREGEREEVLHLRFEMIHKKRVLVAVTV